jgi:hypothetical protein
MANVKPNSCSGDVGATVKNFDNEISFIFLEEVPPVPPPGLNTLPSAYLSLAPAPSERNLVTL